MMKLFALTCISLIGCSGASVFRDPNPAPVAPSKPEASFIAIDKTHAVSARSQPSIVVLEEKELGMAPPFRAVGVLQLEAEETKSLAEFYEAAADAGASVGCDVIYQRDAFELGSRVVKPQLPLTSDNGIGGFVRNSGREWKRNDRVLWQFLCGVTGASEEEQAQSMKAATSLAVDLRRKALGNYEPCDPYTPTGSHVRHNDVCANDPSRRRDVASVPSVGPPGQ